MNNLVVLIKLDLRELYFDFNYRNITVPQGFVFDGNSVPRLFRPFLGQYDYAQASCIHDYLYNTESDYMNISRKQADDIYKNHLIQLGCQKYKACIAYFAVRLFGSKFYKKT